MRNTTSPTSPELVNAVFLVDRVQHFVTALQRSGLRFQTVRGGNRNASKHIIKDIRHGHSLLVVVSVMLIDDHGNVVTSLRRPVEFAQLRRWLSSSQHSSGAGVNTTVSGSWACIATDFTNCSFFDQTLPRFQCQKIAVGIGPNRCHRPLFRCYIYTSSFIRQVRFCGPCRFPLR